MCELGSGQTARAEMSTGRRADLPLCQRACNASGVRRRLRGPSADAITDGVMRSSVAALLSPCVGDSRRDFSACEMDGAAPDALTPHQTRQKRRTAPSCSLLRRVRCCDGFAAACAALVSGASTPLCSAQESRQAESHEMTTDRPHRSRAHR